MSSDQPSSRPSGLRLGLSPRLRPSRLRPEAQHEGAKAQAGVSGGETALREAIRKWRGLRASAKRYGDVDDAPGCVYGVVVGDRLADLQGDLDDIKAEIAWIRRVIVATIVSAGVGTVLRLVGWL